MPEAEHPAFDKFVDTVAQLRAPEGGCAWNRAQTHATLGDYLIEESYEALDAIEAGEPDHLREELGDVLLQVVLHSQIAAEAGEFTIDDVCTTIDEKMIRRHPHVFGDVKAENANEVAELWEQVKLAEKERADKLAAARMNGLNGSNAIPSDQEGSEPHEEILGNGPNVTGSGSGNGAAARESLLDSVPTHFPALLQAQKISRKAVAAGFEWETLSDVWEKVDEERAELEAAYAAAPKTPDGKILSDDLAGNPEGGPAADTGNPASNHATGTNAPTSDCATGTGNPRARDPRVTAAEMEFGDLLFALVNVARKMGIDAESALRASNAKFRRRFARIEAAAWEQGKSVEDLSLDEMEAHWQKAKEAE